MRQNKDLTRIRILLIEDSATDARHIRQELEAASSHGPTFETTNVTRLGDALGLLGEQRFDVVLLDLNLPDSRGVETFTQIADKHLEVPIIVLSGAVDDELAASTVTEGAQDYVAKEGLTGAVLSKTIRYAIARWKLSVIERQHAERLARMRSDFVATMSHEIRTPMNGVIGMTSMLLKTKLTGEQRECVEVIRNSGELLLSLISDILDYSKIEAGKLLLESLPVELAGFVAEVVKPHAELARQKGLAIEIVCDPEAPKEIHGDPVRLRQVLGNLIGNAIKFTPKGRITVSVGPPLVKAAARPWVRFEIRDTGIGISAETCRTLFEPFTQADPSTTREFGGTGLGLAICKKLVALMHGRIGADSEEGRGSTFWFEVPSADEERAVRQEPKRRLREEGPLPRFAEKQTVLIVEDNLVNQKVVAKMLDKLGLESAVAADGAEAIEAVRSGSFAAVLMDYSMPVMDGLEATRRIRRREADESRPRLPIIAMTANAFKEDERECREAGMDDYLAKPVTIEALADTLASFLAVAGKAVAEKATAGKAAPERRPSLDPKTLSALTELGGAEDGDFLRDLIDLFLQTVPPVEIDLAKAIRTKDSRAMRHVAHKLKGLAGNLGATTVVELSAELEKRGAAGETGGCDELMASLQKELRRVETDLDSFRRRA